MPKHVDDEQHRPCLRGSSRARSALLIGARAFALVLAGCFDSTSDGEGSGRGLVFDGSAFSAARIAINPERLNFGRVAVGGIKTYQVGVRNSGAVRLTITGIVLAFGEENYQIQIAGQPPAAVVDDPDQDGVPGLAPEQGFLVDVTLRGADVTRAVGSLVISSDAFNRAEAEVVLVGRVTEPRCLELPAEVTFDPLRIGQSQERTFQIRACNESSVTIQSVQLEGQGPFDSAAPLPPFRVPPQQEVTIRFEPASPGDFSSALLVTSDDDRETDRRVAIRGQAVVNLCPVASVSEPRGEPQQNEWFRLDGSGSVDPDGEGGRPLEYHWRLASGPELAATEFAESSNGAPDDVTTPSVIFRTDLPGNYNFQLRVTDERPLADVVAECPDAIVNLRVLVARNPKPEFEVTWGWTTPGQPDPRREGSKVDLLLRHPLARSWQDPEYVCTYGSDCVLMWDPEQGSPVFRDFSRPGEPLRLVEIMRPRETNGTPYRVALVYEDRFDDDEFDYGPTVAFVEVKSGGRVLFNSTALEGGGLMVDEGTVWEVFDFAWPPGQVRAVNRMYPGPP